MKDAEIVIVSAARTPVGSFGGSLSAVPAHTLGETAIRAALERAGVDAGDVDEVIMGQVLTAGEGQNPARQAAMAAGVPQEATACGINQVCGSGLRAVALGAQQIALGDADIVVAGGQENMSSSPHVANLRNGQKMGDVKFIDTMIKDGLWEAFNGYHMGNTAENVAKQWQLTRDEQDTFAVASQNKAEAAQKAGKFKDEIAPVTIKTRKGEVVVEEDEYIREGATVDGIAKLRPAFDKEGTVTAGNASGINDGAAAVVLMTAEEAKKRGSDPTRPHRLLGDGGRRSRDHGYRPDPGLPQGAGEGRLEDRRPRPGRGQRGLCRAGPAVNKDMGWDRRKVNVNGGAIAIGHPIGASGTRVLITLLHEMQRRTPRRVSPRCASAAAWALRCALSAANPSLLSFETISCGVA